MNFFAKLIIVGLCLVAIVKSFNKPININSMQNTTYEIRGGL